MVAGLGVASSLGPWALLPVAWAWLVYDRAIRHEEETMRGVGGELGARCRASVPRWLPALRAFEGPALEPASPREVARREWRLIVGIPLALGPVPVTDGAEGARHVGAELTGHS